MIRNKNIFNSRKKPPNDYVLPDDVDDLLGDSDTNYDRHGAFKRVLVGIIMIVIGLILALVFH